MLHAWVVAGLLAAREAPPPPLEIRVGDSKEVALASGAPGVEFRLALAVAEPLSLLAECADSDVSLRVEDGAGGVLDQDDDSGIETDACLNWTPRAAGEYRVRVLAKGGGSGSACLTVLRGAIEPVPSDPDLAARAYWDRALDRAKARGDDARATLARSRLDALEDRAGHRGDSERRDAAIGEARALLLEAEAAEKAQDFSRSRERAGQALERLSQVSGARDDAVVADASEALGEVALRIGELRVARETSTLSASFFERTLPEGHPRTQLARLRRADAMIGLGDARGARVIFESVLPSLESERPDGDPFLEEVRGRLAFALKCLGDLAGAGALEEKALSTLERRLPEKDLRVIEAQANLASTLAQSGELARARELQEKVLAALERALPEDAPRLQAARGNLASTLARMKDFARARALYERALSAWERHLPEDHPDLLLDRGNLAAVLAETGDLAGARALQERVLATLTSALPADHREVQRARANLAAMLYQMGDAVGARALQETALGILERSLPQDHPELQLARSNLAASMQDAGDLAGARRLWTQVLSTRERTLPPDHPELWSVRLNLSGAAREMGDLAAAIALAEKVVASQEKVLPQDHPSLAYARTLLALALRDKGDVDAARALALQEQALRALERAVPEDHPFVAAARRELAWTAAWLGDAGRVGALLAAIARGSRHVTARSTLLSARESAETVQQVSRDIDALLSLGPAAAGADDLARSTFALAETRRVVATGGGLRRCDGGDDPDIARLRAECLEARRRSADLVARSRSIEVTERSSAEEVARAAGERDRIERSLREALVARGVVVPIEVEVAALARALPEDGAAVGYLRYARSDVAGGEGFRRSVSERLLAHVVRPDGSLRRVDLGLMADVEKAVARWRAAIGAPVSETSGSRSSQAAGRRAAAAKNEEIPAGEALRRCLLDPVIEAAGSAATLHVVLDDVLHLVPLEALPLESGVAGDRYRFRVEASFARLLSRREGAGGAPVLVAVGDVDYEAEGSAPAGRSLGGALPLAARGGGRADALFEPLHSTRGEIDVVAKLFESALGVKGEILVGPRATKSALVDVAPRARFLHVATHGYFAPESLRTTADPEPGRMSFEQTVCGFAPLSVCGLALAGANRGMDRLGRVPGILTAEELAGVDLGGCELAVLAACDTHAGMRRAGLGIQSLQAALHAAGARAAVTSLWPVDDLAARAMMEAFYRRLLVDGRPKAQALWEAKQSLRSQGAATREWAGWVLTGDADGSVRGPTRTR